ncbi:MAG: Hsp70 family protein [Pirellulales bacterium]
MDADLSPSRYVVGIDLGTTNSAVAYVDTSEAPWHVRDFLVPQLVGPSEVEARETLPSFHYQPATGEISPGALKLPWSKEEPGYTVGFFARDHGALVPGRMISSAKSWLSHTGVDRTADLLPWHGAADVERLSPVEASARYLRHVREAWDAAHPRDLLAEQDFVLTLPASFDEVARELTVEAAKRAGLPRVVLIEEPQAAFYAWIHKHADDWEKFVSAGQKILVCDIGGGTTDFTLIQVRRGDETEKVHFHRVAVGEHLILGGDNQDLALAHHLEQRILSRVGSVHQQAAERWAEPTLQESEKLPPRQWDLLVRACRRVKETLLGEDAPERMTVNLSSGGSRLMGGLQIDVSRDEVRELIVEGFFPRVALDDKPAARRSGFQEFGLPYAADAAMTRYLAAFLTAHRNVTAGDEPLPADHDPARPDIVLFNGGLFASPDLRTRLVESLESWFRNPAKPEQREWSPLVLDHDRLDLAVARGAAYYGMVRRGAGVRIAADLARTYYIGVAEEAIADRALCLVPASAEPGQEIELADREFHLLISEPVEFPLYTSSTRLTDRPGELVAVDREQMTALSPIRTVLKARGRADDASVPVRLHARLTEIGTLDLWAAEREGPGSWRMQFDVRSATQTNVAGHAGAGELQGFIDEASWQAARREIESTFGGQATEKPDGIMKRLAAALGMSKPDWPMSLLRRIWDALVEDEPGRRRSAAHEARWLNLLGYALRPGYGLALDDWRVAETWRLLHGKLVHAAAMCQHEWWILWRRIAGGLTAGQQRALADPLLAPIRGLHKRLVTGKGGSGDLSFGASESIEVWRLLGSLELLPPATKIELGGVLLDVLPKRKMEPVRPAVLWTLGRVAARVPVYGPLNVVVPAEAVGDWIARLLDLSPDDTLAPWAMMQLTRRTGDRYRDVSAKLRSRVVERLKGREAPVHFIKLVSEGGELDVAEQSQAFGEALPKGLRIL